MRDSQNTPDQMFYKEAINFYQSGLVIANSEKKLDEEIDLFSSIIFLYRHSIELIMKALIIKQMRKEGITNWDAVKLPPCNKKITNVHSLQELLNIWNYKEDDPEGIEDICTIIANFDNYDFSSTFFRYPVDRQRNRNEKGLTEDVDELLLSMPCSFGNFVYHEGKEKFSCLHREHLLDSYEDDLPIIIETLINKFNESN